MLFVAACCTKAANDYGIADVAVVGRRTIPSFHTPEKAEKIEKAKARKEEKKLMREVPDDVIRRVDALLPQQPWKPGIHHEIASTLGLDPTDVSAGLADLSARAAVIDSVTGWSMAPTGMSSQSIVTARSERG